MADRTAAEIFGTVFIELAKKPTPENKALAKRLHKKSENYDFSQCQMDCDGALKKLGIKIEDYGDDE